MARPRNGACWIPCQAPIRTARRPARRSVPRLVSTPPRSASRSLRVPLRRPPTRAGRRYALGPPVLCGSFSYPTEMKTEAQAPCLSSAAVSTISASSWAPRHRAPSAGRPGASSRGATQGARAAAGPCVRTSTYSLQCIACTNCASALGSCGKVRASGPKVSAACIAAASWSWDTDDSPLFACMSSSLSRAHAGKRARISAGVRTRRTRWYAPLCTDSSSSRKARSGVCASPSHRHCEYIRRTFSYASSPRSWSRRTRAGGRSFTSSGSPSRMEVWRRVARSRYYTWLLLHQDVGALVAPR